MVSISLPRISKTAAEAGIEQSAPVSGEKRFNLLRSFALTSLFVMSTIGLLSGLLLGNYLTESLLKRDAEVTRAFIQSLTEVEGGVGMFRPGDISERERLYERTYDLPELIEHIATIPGVVRANLYSDKAKVLMSTQADLIGKRFAANHELEDALRGRTVFELKYIKAEQKAEYAMFGSEITRLVENYLPIRDLKNNRVVAVVEIYKAPKTLFDAIEAARALVWICVAGATLFLYATLFWIVYRASHLIRSQQLRLVESETMVAVGEMASAVAHSVRNPIAAIRSGAELMQETSRDPVVREAADDIINETDRVEQWVRELLIFSRPEGTTQFNSAHLDRILRQCLEGYIRLIKRNNVQLEYRIDEDIPPIKGDAGLLGQVFNSILGNALEAMPDGGTLTAEAHYVNRDKAILISISDTGHGIPEDRLDGLFESCLTTKSYGLGIGMLLANRIVKRHGGKISLSSQVGIGTTTRLSFPEA